MSTSSKNNVGFDYLYRDAGNNKKFGCVVFSCGESDIDLAELDKNIRANLFNENNFVPEAVGIARLNLDEYGHESGLDHPWNEYDGLSFTDEPATDSRTIVSFVKEFAAVKKPADL
jgi:hypothetical protein